MQVAWPTTPSVRHWQFLTYESAYLSRLYDDQRHLSDTDSRSKFKVCRLRGSLTINGIRHTH